MTTTGLVFVLFYFAGLGLALFRDPLFGLYTYVAEFYLHPPSRWWGEALPDLRWSLLAAAVTLIAILIRLPTERGKDSWLTTFPAKVMIVFALWFWVVSFWALDGELHHAAAIQVSKYVLVFFMVYRLLDTPKRTIGFLLMHASGCLYLGLVAHSLGAPGGRLDGVGGPGIDDSNTLGMQMATGVVVAAMLALHVRGWRLALCLTSIAFSLNTIVLTASRGAFLALLGAGITLAYLKPTAYRRQFYAFAMLGLVSLALVATQGFWDRMATTQLAVNGNVEQMDTSAYSRIVMVEAQIRMAALYPFGAGHRGSEVLSHQFLDQQYMSDQGGRSSHNVFMTLLVEEGIPGAIMFFAMIGWVAATLVSRRRVWAKDRREVTSALLCAAIGGALTVVLIGGLFADFSQSEVQVWLLAALAAVARHRSIDPVTISERMRPSPALTNQHV